MCDINSDTVVCGENIDEVVSDVICKPDSEVVCQDNNKKWISFEPTVEFKFSNLHAANQIVNDRLICTVKDGSDN